MAAVRREALAFAAFVTEFEPANVPLVVVEMCGAEPTLATIAEGGGGFIARFVHRRDGLAGGLGLFLAERFPSRLRFHKAPRWCGLYASWRIWEEESEAAKTRGQPREPWSAAFDPLKRSPYNGIRWSARDTGAPGKLSSYEHSLEWLRYSGGVWLGWLGYVRLSMRKNTRQGASQVPASRKFSSSRTLLTSGRESFLCRPAGSPRKLKNAMAGRPVVQKTEKEPVEIKLAHSPDSDDAFMFYALATHKLATPGYKYTHILSDIQTLNEAALTETYDVTAVSFAAYPSIRDKYVLLDCGASFGEGYGPIVVSAKPMKKEDIKGRRIGVPGLKTTAYLSLKLYEPEFEAVVMPFDKILDAVQNELVEAGLLIHEGQLMYPQLGMHKVLDLGIWWQEMTGLPLPLGGNAVKKSLGPEMGRLIAKTIRESVEYGLEHRDDALKYAMQFARDMETELADQFVGMYVNKWTLGYGEKGKTAVKELIERGTKAGLLAGPAKVEFLSE